MLTLHILVVGSIQRDLLVGTYCNPSRTICIRDFAAEHLRQIKFMPSTWSYTRAMAILQASTLLEYNNSDSNRGKHQAVYAHYFKLNYIRLFIRRWSYEF
jgi:hypothetical protein